MKTLRFFCCPTCGIKEIQIDPSSFKGEAWRLARVLRSTVHRDEDEGVIAQSLHTNLDLARAEGWSEKQIARTSSMHDTWATTRPRIDWKLSPLCRPGHHVGPITDPETLTLLASAWIQNEAARIITAQGTVVARGDLGVILTSGDDESCVLLPDEQNEAEVTRMLDALFGKRSHGLRDSSQL